MAKQSAMDKVFNGLLKEAQNILEGGGSAEQRNVKAVKFLKLAQQARKLDDGDIEEEVAAPAAKPAITAPKAEKVADKAAEPPKVDATIAAAAVANGAGTTEKKFGVFGR